jgi:16S rRNA C1402 (ribose-2'-O) methylase RsmI
MKTLQGFVVQRDDFVTVESNRSTQELLEKLHRVSYVLDCQKQAIERHPHQLIELRVELAWRRRE